MERARRTGTKKQGREAVRAALRAARDGTNARSDQWEQKEEKDVYEQVTESEYADIVRKRRQNEDFVVDDDGLGYFDDGEEHFGEDEAEGLEKAAPKQRGVIHARSKDAVRKARKLKEARSDDGVQTSKMTQFLGSEAPKAKKPVTKQLDAFESLIDGLGGSASMEVASIDLGGGLGLVQAQQAPTGPKALNTPRRMTYDSVAPPPMWGAGVDLESSAFAGGDDMGMGFGMADDDEPADVPGALPVTKDAPEPQRAPLKKKSRFSKDDTVVEASAAAEKAMAMDVDVKPAVAAPALPQKMDMDVADDSAPAVDPNYGGGATVNQLEEKEWLRGDDGERHCWMYWLDCVEQSGSVYLLGKIRLEGEEERFASCCCVVKNVERSFFVLPRVDPESGSRFGMKDVWEDVRSALVPTCVPKSEPLKCKGVKRGYAFGDEDVPRSGDTEYLKVKYASRHRAPPVSLCKRGTRSIEKILGAGSTPLEQFLVKRKLMGPCWVKIEKPVSRDSKVSWCVLEVEVPDAKKITLARDCPYGPPPLVCTTLSVKTAVNPKTHQHEIVAVAALTHRGVGLDGATPDGGRGEDQRLFQHSTEKQEAGSRRWTCVAARPLGPDIAGAQDAPLDPKLPRDLHGELKKADHGFLADRGTVTVAPNERALISVLLARIQRDDPDVLCGHNILGFELDVLLARALALKVGNAWSKVGRLKRNKPPHKWKASSGRDTFHASATSGRLICDTYLAAREHLRSATTYALPALAETQLGVRGRRSLEPRQVAQLLGSGSQNVCGLLRHAAEDCRLVERLALRLQVLPLSKQLTSISGNLLGNTLKGKRAERIEYLLLHEFHRMKFLAPEKQRYDADDDDVDHSKKRKKKADPHKRAKATYAGGLVLEPKKGFYDSHVLLLDFASLYPSIIQEYDLCFSTVDWAPVAKRMEARANGESDAKKARTESDDGVEEAAEELPPLPVRGEGATGVLPRVLKNIISKRREVKGLLKKEKNQKKRETYEIRQMALKLTANSMYGCLGFSHSRFYAKPLAAMVTSLGRDCLMAAVDVAEKELGLEVIYGDTDSIMINTRTDDLAVVKDLGLKVKKAVNKRYRLLELELDGIFKTMLLLKKKKYAALVVNEQKDGSITLHKETKGLDMVRRDWCPLSKRTGAKVLDYLLSGDQADVVVANVHKVLEDVCKEAREGRVSVADFVVTRGLNKPVEKYPDSKSQPHLRVAKAMLKEGRAVNVGDHIPYVICLDGDGASSKKGIADRTEHPDNVDSDTTIVDKRNEKIGAPVMVTPGGPPVRPKVDVEWYLAQQILPPIARLCEPIAGMSKASIADRLGLDARKFEQHLARSQQALVEAEARGAAFVPMACMGDEERFGDCAPVQVECASCHVTKPLMLWPKRSEDSTDDAPPCLKCPSCNARLLGHASSAACFSRLSVALQLATRGALKRYYEGWMLCDDATCGARTRQLSGAGPRCLRRGCRGRMVAEESEKRIYTQLCYQKALFSAGRVACAQNSDEAEVCAFLERQVAQDVEASAYNFVRPSIFSIFGQGG